jgi:hypothetical protein
MSKRPKAMQLKDLIKQATKIKLGELFEVDGKLYTITINTNPYLTTNLSDNRNIYELTPSA